MLISRKDKIVAAILVFFFFLAWLILAWLSKSGGFKILADVITKGL